MKELESWFYSDFDTTFATNGNDKSIPIIADGPKQAEVGDKGSGKSKKRASEEMKNSGGGGIGESEHEMHIWTERERRKKMRNMFSSLHALLPQLPPKADKSTIVDEAVNYIKTLENTFEKMQKQKKEKFQSPTTVGQFNPSTTTSTQTQSYESKEAFLADQGPTDHVFSSQIQMAPMTLSTSSFQTWLSPNVVISTCGNDAHFNICTPKKPGLLTTILYILEKHNLNVLSAHVSSDQHRNMYMIHANASHQLQDQALSIEEIFKLAAGEMNLWFLTC
ncbi:hypothetical protein ACFE04_005978 [Oxalis oulophora]